MKDAERGVIGALESTALGAKRLVTAVQNAEFGDNRK
jgi:hypothetical protein